ncbi:hypothetical protein RBH20_09745 [Haloarcula sp. H-GB4]|uniref:hypothetical protein n=1 Tax=Haloarcula sp. H-GB4 TaxID=3069755 RepID=UPI0027AFADA8|nr:hypothetical protein [Haloarcula sp. H-GB4]MDQ2072816.1 hypothetical protein [Haloarcula sp. H-GB4]
MTRRSKRELSRAIDDLDGQSLPETSIAELLSADNVEHRGDVAAYVDGQLVAIPSAVAEVLFSR